MPRHDPPERPVGTDHPVPAHPPAPPSLPPAGPLQQNATGCNKSEIADAELIHKPHLQKRLTAEQWAALDLLLQGLSDAVVAERVGVDRTTVYRWRSHYGLFHIELERHQRMIVRRNADRMRWMTGTALNVLETALQSSIVSATTLRAAALVLRLATPRPDPNHSARDDFEDPDDEYA